jgi:hypothetical protein
VAGSRVDRLEFLAEEITEVCDSVGGVADELGLSLCTVVLLALNIRKDGRDLTVWHGINLNSQGAGLESLTSLLVGNNLSLALL